MRMMNMYETQTELPKEWMYVSFWEGEGNGKRLFSLSRFCVAGAKTKNHEDNTIITLQFSFLEEFWIYWWFGIIVFITSNIYWCLSIWSLIFFRRLWAYVPLRNKSKRGIKILFCYSQVDYYFKNTIIYSFEDKLNLI